MTASATEAVSSARMTQPCRLCGRLRVLCESHVLPAFCYKRAAQDPVEGRAKQLVFMDFKRGTSVFSNKQLKEHLLCEDCEELFSADETYLSQIVVQNDLTFPWLEAVKRTTGARSADSSALKTDVIARFACSVVYRASVCSLLSTDLGPYRTPLGEYLLGKHALPDEVCVVAKLVDHELLRRSLVPPQQRRSGDGSCRMCWFVICGAAFQVYVGKSAPALHDACIARKGVVALSDGQEFLDLYGRDIQRSVPKGALARWEHGASRT